MKPHFRREKTIEKDPQGCLDQMSAARRTPEAKKKREIENRRWRRTAGISKLTVRPWLAFRHGGYRKRRPGLPGPFDRLKRCHSPKERERLYTTINALLDQVIENEKLQCVGKSVCVEWVCLQTGYRLGEVHTIFQRLQREGRLGPETRRYCHDSNRDPSSWGGTASGWASNYYHIHR